MVRLVNPCPGPAPQFQRDPPGAPGQGAPRGRCTAPLDEARCELAQYTARCTTGGVRSTGGTPRGLPSVYRWYTTEGGDARDCYRLVPTPARLLARLRPGVHGRTGTRVRRKGRFWYTAGLLWPGKWRAEESLLTNQPLCQLSYAGVSGRKSQLCQVASEGRSCPRSAPLLLGPTRHVGGASTAPISWSVSGC
jgi:hypothetical protein